VEEEADRRRGAGLPKEAGQEHELVVVDPDQVSRLERLEDGVAEAPVGLHIGGPSRGIELDVGREVVEERPEGLVGVALVEVPGHVGGKLDGDVAVLALPAGEVLGADRVLAGGISGPAQPEPARPLEHGIQRAGQAAGAALRAPGLSRPAQGQGQPVRHDDEASFGRHGGAWRPTSS